jgi:hypothetical protein
MTSIDWRVLGDESDPHRWYPTAMLNGLGSPDFNTFAHNVLRKRPGFVTEMYGWYARPGVTFIGRTEHLRRDLLRAFNLMHLPFDREIFDSIPPQNESPAHIPMPEWDPQLRLKILRVEYAGYLRYGYPVNEAMLLAA